MLSFLFFKARTSALDWPSDGADGSTALSTTRGLGLVAFLTLVLSSSSSKTAEALIASIRAELSPDVNVFTFLKLPTFLIVTPEAKIYAMSRGSMTWTHQETPKIWFTYILQASARQVPSWTDPLQDSLRWRSSRQLGGSAVAFRYPRYIGPLSPRHCLVIQFEPSRQFLESTRQACARVVSNGARSCCLSKLVTIFFYGYCKAGLSKKVTLVPSTHECWWQGNGHAAPTQANKRCTYDRRNESRKHIVIPCIPVLHLGYNFRHRFTALFADAKNHFSQVRLVHWNDSRQCHHKQPRGHFKICGGCTRRYCCSVRRKRSGQYGCCH